MSKNKMRRERSKLPYIYMGVIGFLLLLGFCIYITYLALDYMNYNHISTLGMSDYLAIANLIAAPIGSLPITGSLIAELFKLQVTKLWGVYAAAVAMVFLVATSNNKDDFRGMEQGSAHWAEKYDEKLFRDATGIPMGKNFYATITNPKGKYYSPHNLNETVIGGSGAGKSFRKIIPDIQQMIGSYVVTDPKGELYRNTAKFLTEAGYKIRVLNLDNINYSNAYNPFAYMVDEQDCISVANLFMANSAGEGEKADFWASAAEDLLVAIMVYLFKTEDETKSFGRVIRLVNSIRYKGGKIDQRCELARCFNRHQISYPDDVVTVNWNSLQGTPEETLGSIAKTLSTRLRLWATNDVDEITDQDEMDFDHIGTEKTAVFLIIPAARQTYKTVANIFYSQLFERLMYIANRDHAGRLPLLVSCELDEFANIGKIPNFGETLAVVRSYNIRICIVLQGLSQLKAIYEKTWNSIIGNCSLFTFLGTNDTDSNEYVSKRLGKTTVRVDARSYNRGNQGGGSDSESYNGRELLAADEIPKAIRPKGKNKKFGGACILFVDELYPFFMNKFDTKHHPLYEKTGSSYPSGIPNNTNIKETYATIKADREKRYQLKMAEARERDQRWEIEDQQRAEAQEQAEQADLSAEFNAAAAETTEPNSTTDFSSSDRQADSELQAEIEAAMSEITDELQAEIQDISEDEFEASLSDEDDIVDDF